MLSLPGFLLRKLSRGWRLAAIAAGVLVLAALVVGTALLVPVITRDKRETARRERTELERHRAAERRRLLREQLPRRGRLASEAAQLPALEAAITADARRRVAAGELPTAVRRTDCEPLARRGGRLLVDCTAVTSDIPASAESRGGRVGYPYRAALDPSSRRYAFCKTSGSPGEGSLGSGLQVELPRACGG